MELINPQEHRSCLNFDNSEMPGIQVRKLSRGQSEEMMFSRNEIVFILEGKARFLFRDHPMQEVEKGQFFFIPVGGLFRYKATKNSMALVMRFNGQVRLCSGFKMEQLYNKSRPADLPENPLTLSTLEIKSPIWYFLNGLTACIIDGLNCKLYYETKAQELFILLRSYYPKEQLYRFFYPILSGDTAFSEYIRANYHKYKTVREMATAVHLSTPQFTRKFRQVFGQAPYDWMKEQRSRGIYEAIRGSNKPFKQIADEHGFSVQTQFSKYCRDNFGKNPGEIRNEPGE